MKVGECDWAVAPGASGMLAVFCSLSCDVIVWMFIKKYSLSCTNIFYALLFLCDLYHNKKNGRNCFAHLPFPPSLQATHFNREKSTFLSSRTLLNTGRKCHPIPTFWVFLLILPLTLQPQSAFGLPSKGQQLTIWPNTLSPSNKSPAFQPVIFVSPLPKVLPQTLSQFCTLGFVTCSTLLSVWVQNFTSAVSYKGPNESFFKKNPF